VGLSRVSEVSIVSSIGLFFFAQNNKEFDRVIYTRKNKFIGG